MTDDVQVIPIGVPSCNTHSPLELHGDFSDISSLITGTLQLYLARLSRTVAIRNSRSAVRGVAHNFRHTHLTLKSVRQAYHDEAKVQQYGVEGENRGFLTTVLGSAGAEY